MGEEGKGKLSPDKVIIKGNTVKEKGKEKWKGESARGC